MASNIPQLYNMPEELIIIIFSNCDKPSLKNLALTCRKFSQIIKNEDHVWMEASRDVFGSNMSSPSMIKRCKPILPYKDRFHLSKRWRKSLGKRTKIVEFDKCMPWMVLERDHLYLSKGRSIVRYKRSEKGNICPQPIAQTTPCNDDIAKFATTDDEVVCAGRDGKIARLDKGLHIVNTFGGHPADVLAIDTKKDLIVSGCKMGFIKIWKPLPKTTDWKSQIKINNKIISMAITPSKRSVLVGTPGTRGVHPLQMFDIERCTPVDSFGKYYRFGAGILGILPETYHTFLSCGYDTTLRLWDIRTPEQCESIWTDPFDSTLYCVQSDHNNTMITGAAHHGVFLVWDNRRPDHPINLYYTQELPERRSGRMGCYYTGPIFCATFDASHIFVTTERMLMQYSYMDYFP